MTALTPADRRDIERAREVLAEAGAARHHDAFGLAEDVGRLWWACGNLLAILGRLAGEQS